MCASRFSTTRVTLTLPLFLVFLSLIDCVSAFGAGSIPNYTYLNDKAFRHGDIEEILPNLLKNIHLGGSEGIWGVLKALLTFGMAGGGLAGAKFSKMDVQRIYFGNWLRDFSQAMDIGGLKTFTDGTLLMIIRLLGFMTFGFATVEFEVTPERLGVYLPVEHIDNPKGYAEKEGDARLFHPKLRGPVDLRELDINPHNGMKNYIATEGQSWDTSTSHIRRTLLECIRLGRKSKGRDCPDQYEALRFLGTALHTLEDLTAHSNWCELALRKLGHPEVFCHVGETVIIKTPSGPAPPLVTGTFGSADFMHSVLGEGMDRLSEASMSNITEKLRNANIEAESHIPILHTLLSEFIPSAHARNQKVEQAESLKAKAYDLTLDHAAPQEMQDLLWSALEWRDSTYREILGVISVIPGLQDAFERLTETLNAFVFSLLDPFLRPILEDVIKTLHDGSEAVIDSDEHYQIFTDPFASDPSHSILAKDHFALILNEPAGKVARVIVEYTVTLVVKAWREDREDPNVIIDKILESIHHPYFAKFSSEIQEKMMACMTHWLTSMHPEDRRKVLDGLTKDGVREGRNKRFKTKEELEAGEERFKLEEMERQIELSKLEQLGANSKATMNFSAVGEKERCVRYRMEKRPPTFERFDGMNAPHRRTPVIIEEEDEGLRYRRLPNYLPGSDEEDEAFSEKPPAVHAPIPVEGRYFRPATMLAESEAAFLAALRKEGIPEHPWTSRRNPNSKGKKPVQPIHPVTPIHAPVPGPTFDRFDTLARKQRREKVCRPLGDGQGRRDTPPPLYDEEEGSSIYNPVYKVKYRRAYGWYEGRA